MGALSMSEKVGLLKVELGLPPNTPMAAVVKQANEKMGLVGEGPLPGQARPVGVGVTSRGHAHACRRKGHRGLE